MLQFMLYKPYWRQCDLPYAVCAYRQVTALGRRLRPGLKYVDNQTFRKIPSQVLRYGLNYSPTFTNYISKYWWANWQHWIQVAREPAGAASVQCLLSLTWLVTEQRTDWLTKPHYTTHTPHRLKKCCISSLASPRSYFRHSPRTYLYLTRWVLLTMSVTAWCKWEWCQGRRYAWPDV